MPALPEKAQHDAGQTQQRSDRQINLASDDNQRHGEGHDGYFHDVTGERILKVKAAQEIRRENTADHHSNQEKEHKQSLPGNQERFDPFHTFFLLERIVRCTQRMIKASSTTAPIIAAP